MDDNSKQTSLGLISKIENAKHFWVISLFKEANKVALLKRNKRKPGFSLIEVLLSLVVLIFCMLMIIEVFPVSVKAVNQGVKNILATQIALRELEFAKHLKWDELTSENPIFQNRITKLTTKVNGVESITEFRTIITILPLPEDPDNIKTIKVAVEWDYNQATQTNPPHKVQMEVMVAREQ